jgi:amino acid transporter
MKITKNIKYLLVTLACFSLFFNSNQALATTPTGDESPWLKKVQDSGLKQIGNTSYEVDDKPSDLREIIANIIQIVIGMLGVIFSILILVGGYRWMTAGGNQEKVTSAQKTITTAAIGLLIILSSLAITWYITERAKQVSNVSHPSDWRVKR